MIGVQERMGKHGMFPSNYAKPIDLFSRILINVEFNNLVFNLLNLKMIIQMKKKC